MKDLGLQISPKKGSCLCQKRKELDRENSMIQKADRQIPGEREKECVKLLLAKPLINTYE